MQEVRKTIRNIIGFQVGCILTIIILQLVVFFIVQKYTVLGIENTKDAVYTMYNEGLAMVMDMIR